MLITAIIILLQYSSVYTAIIAVIALILVLIGRFA